MCYQCTTGLDPEQTREVVAKVFEVEEPGHAGRGGQCCWDFYRQVEMVLVMLRHNLTQMTNGDLFGVGQPTVWRVWRHLLPLIEEVTWLHGIGLAEATRERTLLVAATSSVN